MKIQDIMSTPVLTCRPTDSLRDAAQLMWEHDCGALPVTDGDGAIVGMVTDRDICMGAYLKGAPLDVIPVSDVMARQVHACRPSDTVDKAERVMSANQVRRLPVIDGGRRLVGFLSMSDVVREVASRHVASSGRAVTETLAAISQPRAAPPEARALRTLSRALAPREPRETPSSAGERGEPRRRASAGRGGGRRAHQTVWPEAGDRARPRGDRPAGDQRGATGATPLVARPRPCPPGRRPRGRDAPMVTACAFARRWARR